MLEYRSKDSFTIHNVGVVHIIRLKRAIHDLKGLKGKQIKLDGVVYRIKGVEAFMHAPPWRKGEAIGLLVERTNRRE